MNQFSPLIRIAADRQQTRILVTWMGTDVGKLILPGVQDKHPRAMATLLEGISMCLGERVRVVLSVDEQSSIFGLEGVLDGLGFGQRSVFFDVGIAGRLRKGSARKILLRGDFRDLRQLGLEVG